MTPPKAVRHVLILLIPVLSAAVASAARRSAVAWLPEGRAVVALPAAGGLELRFSGLHPRSLEDFTETVPLSGPDAVGGVLLASNDGRLEVWTAANGRVVVVSALLPVTRQTRWHAAEQSLSGGLRLKSIAGRGSSGALVVQHEPSRTGSSLYHATFDGKSLQVRPLFGAPDYVAGASAAMDETGRLHLAWSQGAPEQPVCYQAINSAGTSGSDLLTILGGGQQPAITLDGEDVLLAMEGLDGGISIHWIRGNRVVRRRSLGGRMHFRPEFSRDDNGVVWVFALDAGRRALYQRRLLGGDFGPEQIAYGVAGRWEHALGFALAAPRLVSAPGFAILHHEDLPEGGAPRHRFDLLPVPRLSVNDGRRVLFLDLLEVAAMENTVQRLGVAVKSDRNPLALNGPAGSPDEAKVSYANVLFENDRFRMWYTTGPNTTERNWNIAYAESTDGIAWTKPDLGLVEYAGSRKNNLLFPNFANPATQPTGANAAIGLVFKDERDADAGRRYKMIFTSAKIPGDEAVTGANTYLTWSADGIQWNLKPHRLWGKSPGKNQVIRGQAPFIEPLSSFFFDPDEPRADYRWKLYGLESYVGHPHMDARVPRTTGVVHGAVPEDLIPWPQNPVLDPRTGEDEDQNHGAMVQRYAGIYVALYQHWWGADWKVDLRLATSRDGLHFTRVVPGEALLPLGTTGAWDAMMLATPNVLIERQDKLWLYYRGSPGSLAPGRALSRGNPAGAVAPGEPFRHYTGLAWLRPDGFSYLTVAPLQRTGTDARFHLIDDYDLKLEARLRTIPIEAAGIGGRTLHANVGSLAPRFAWVKAQLRDAATDQVVPGFAFADSDPLAEDRLDHTFSWKGRSSLAAVPAARVRVEFLLFGMLESPKLYSFWFE